MTPMKYGASKDASASYGTDAVLSDQLKSLRFTLRAVDRYRIVIYVPMNLYKISPTDKMVARLRVS